MGGPDPAAVSACVWDRSSGRAGAESLEAAEVGREGAEVGREAEEGGREEAEVGREDDPRR